MKRNATIVWAAIFSWLIAMVEFTTAAYGIFCVVFKDKNNESVKRDSLQLEKQYKTQHHYNYYMEFPNGSRIRQFVPIIYDDRQAQTLFLHNVLLIFALPGFLMPLLLFLAERRKKYYLYVWWICWITLQNVHSLVDFFVMLIKCLVNLRCAVIHNDIHKLSIYFSSFCYFITFAKDLLTPFTIYLSISVLNYYRRLSFNSARHGCITANGERLSDTSNSTQHLIFNTKIEKNDLVTHKNSQVVKQYYFNQYR